MLQEQIKINRLRVKPQARYCVDCREVVEKKIHIQNGITNFSYKKFI